MYLFNKIYLIFFVLNPDKKIPKKNFFRVILFVLYFSKRNTGKNKILFDSYEIWIFQWEILLYCLRKNFWEIFFLLKFFFEKIQKSNSISLTIFYDWLWRKGKKNLSKKFFLLILKNFQGIFFIINSQFWKFLPRETLLWISVEHINGKIQRNLRILCLEAI